MREEENKRAASELARKGKVRERFFHDQTLDAIKERLDYSRAKAILPVIEVDRPEGILPATNWEEPSPAERVEANANGKNSRSSERRKAWVDVLCTGNKYIFFTIAFKHSYSDKEMIDSLKFFINAVNRKVFGPRWKESGRSIEGACVAEPHEVSVDFRGNLHFHTVLEYQPAIEDIDGFRKSAVEAAFHVKDRMGRHMIDESVLDVQPIRDMQGLAFYLTKSIDTHQWRYGDNVFFIHDGWLDGFAVPENRKSWEY